MARLYGWTGRILRVDLTAEKTSDVPTSDYVPKFVGGSGVCAKIAWDELPPKVGAFDPQNRLIFMTGPMAGTSVPASARTQVACISPVTYPTEDYVRSNFGGFWASELKFAGYDGLIIQGRASNPVYLWITDGKAEIRDATKYWGMDTFGVQDALWEDTGSKRVQVACIGPAAENLVRFAGIGTEQGCFAGTGGTGAVMGSKKLKAIAVKGTGSVEVAKPDELAEYALWVRRQMYRPEARPPAGLDQIGVHRLGRGGLAEGGEESFKAHLKRYSMKSRACFGCPMACRPFFSIPDAIRPGISEICLALHGWYDQYDRRAHGGRYTSVYLKASALLNALGLCAFEVGFRIIPWLKGCLEERLLTPNETGISLDGLGEYEWIEKLANMITYRQGFGDKLAEGIVRASHATAKIGQRHIDDINRGFAGYYEPRMWSATALESATDSSLRLDHLHPWAARTVRKNVGHRDGTGWITLDEWVAVVKDVFGREDIIDHTGGAFYAPDKAWLAKWLEDYRTATTGGMELCDWLYPMWWSWYSDKPYRRGFSPLAEAKMFSLVTGVDLGVNAMLEAGERIRNLERAIMVREGRRRDNDTLSAEYFRKVQKSFPVPGSDGVFVPQDRALDKAEFEKLKDHYYAERGWDLATGIPTRGKLEELALKDVADQLGV